MSNFSRLQTDVIKLIKEVRLERKKKMTDFVTSLIRTGVPYLVGAIASWLVTLGVQLTPEQELQLGSFLTFTFGTLWYIVFRKLEQKFPKLGWFLGSPKQPEYK